MPPKQLSGFEFAWLALQGIVLVSAAQANPVLTTSEVFPVFVQCWHKVRYQPASATSLQLRLRQEASGRYPATTGARSHTAARVLRPTVPVCPVPLVASLVAGVPPESLPAALSAAHLHRLPRLQLPLQPALQQVLMPHLVVVFCMEVICSQFIQAIMASFQACISAVGMAMNQAAG